MFGKRTEGVSAVIYRAGRSFRRILHSGKTLRADPILRHEKPVSRMLTGHRPSVCWLPTSASKLPHTFFVDVNSVERKTIQEDSNLTYSMDQNEGTPTEEDRVKLGTNSPHFWENLTESFVFF